MKPKELKEGIELAFENPYEEGRKLLLSFFRTLGAKTNPKFSNSKFDDYITKKEREL
jgi:hypothetical protein